MLTRKQYDLLMFIHNRVQRDGVSPSFDEMKTALDLRSKSGIHRLITALEERGFIRRLAHRARAIEIIRLPRNIEERGNGRFRPSVIGGGHARDEHTRGEHARGEHARGETGPAGRGGAIRDPGGRPVREKSGEEQSGGQSDTMTVPMIGRIAAGLPIEALQQGAVQIGVPSLMVTNSGEHYALEVKGDSMIDAGIHEGDIAVIRRQDTANNGDIVVALVDGHEATLKRLRRKGGTVALEAANPAFGTRLYRADQISVQGRLVGLIRTY